MPADDDGYVTAETAVVVPALVLLFGMLLWGVMAAAQHIQVVDGARVGARAAARGEQEAAVRAVALSAAPEEATVQTLRQGDFVRVRVEARSSGPGPLSVALSAEAVAMAEDGTGGTGRAEK
ncbi:TadE family type IV pilus minor pilin [Streptomyces ovatisporus]|uniref:TadE family type IV pilus minor pilin n=1 Tax=Streptomyces ovatisporus TaxID=1128682 RepID=A0ABV9A6U9_9ACTN